MIRWEQWGLTFDDRYPIYRQIVQQFNRAFVRGDILTGERIPSIRELSNLLKVNANTIQRVYQEMERDELINSRRGTGYFVTEDQDRIDGLRLQLVEESMQRFVEEMRALGNQDEDIIDRLQAYLRGGEPDAKGA
ncbi:MAG: GntR family transcriptional regulator [Coriobacteriia bacterium]|nr:GntR family transcriptional regulator [Coriobacteriia bacterium]MCL2137431.1 GntR family transcriptional regulator [Coriobacteriia bacterium]